MENGSGAMKPGFHDGTTRGSGNGAPTAPFSHAYSPHGNIFAALPGDRNFFLFFFIIFLEYIGKKAILRTYRGE